MYIDREGIISTNKPKEREDIINTTESIRPTLAPIQIILSIEEMLGLFLYRWHLLGETELILDDDALLVEAAFGRIRTLGNKAAITLGESFVLLLPRKDAGDALATTSGVAVQDKKSGEHRQRQTEQSKQLRSKTKQQAAVLKPP
ncbi:hypothetical protein BGZ49_009819 [Haplosporangium sp. Z 27]|nr:hypothetical protein BGZ49_009819 [Haplosporangium sp. Z 27]